MFDRIFTKAYARRRMASSHLAIILRPFAEVLCARRHVTTSIQMYVQAVEHFGQWLKMEEVPIHRISSAYVEAFLEGHLSGCRCKIPAVRSIRTCRAALGRLLDFLRETHAISDRPVPPRKIAPAQRLISDYDRHLAQVSGRAASTRLARMRYAWEFLIWRFRKRKLSFYKLWPNDLVNYVSVCAKTLTSGSVGVLFGGLRSFLGFLEFS